MVHVLFIHPTDMTPCNPRCKIIFRSQDIWKIDSEEKGKFYARDNDHFIMQQDPNCSTIGNDKQGHREREGEKKKEREREGGRETFRRHIVYGSWLPIIDDDYRLN